MSIVWFTFRLAPYTRTSLSLLNLLLSSTSLMRARYCSLSWPMLGESLFTATSFPLHTAAYTLPKPPEPCSTSPYQSQHCGEDFVVESATLQMLLWWKQSKESHAKCEQQPSSPLHAFPIIVTACTQPNIKDDITPVAQTLMWCKQISPRHL